MSCDEQYKNAVLSAENKLRKEFLDWRSKTLDRRFTTLGVILSVLTLAVSIGGYFGISQLLDLRSEVITARTDIEKLKGEVQAIVDKSKQEGQDELLDIVRRVSNNEYVSVSTSDFLDIVSTSRQIDEGTIKEFVQSVHNFLSDDVINFYSHEDRWSTSISGGEVFAFRIRNDNELHRALRGIAKVSNAIIARQ